MVKRFVMAALLAVFATGAVAEGRVTLGWGRLFSNDEIGDGRDRWRTGSYTVSRVRGVSWSGYEGVGFGELWELRGYAAMITPGNLTRPSSTDRRYSGVMSLGIVTHFGWKGAEVGLGAELAMTGRQTGLGGLQTWVHGKLQATPPSAGVLDAQIGNRINPGLYAEIGRSYAMGAFEARPFAEARAGVESLVRVGADLTLGALGRDDLMLRDVTTGLRYRGVEGARSEGLSLTVGGDLAHVFSSELLPDGGAAVAEDSRYRLRAGVHWQGKRAAIFYGVSYLSREFTGQPEGQLVGALSLNLRF